MNDGTQSMTHICHIQNCNGAVPFLSGKTLKIAQWSRATLARENLRNCNGPEPFLPGKTLINQWVLVSAQAVMIADWAWIASLS